MVVVFIFFVCLVVFLGIFVVFFFLVSFWFSCFIVERARIIVEHQFIIFFYKIAFICKRGVDEKLNSFLLLQAISELHKALYS